MERTTAAAQSSAAASYSLTLPGIIQSLNNFLFQPDRLFVSVVSSFEGFLNTFLL